MKKYSCVISLISVLVLFVYSAYGQEAPQRDGLTKITDNIYSYVDIKKSTPQSSFGANAGIIIGKDGIVVIDTLTSSIEAKRFIKDIRAISDKPIKYVINTHYHPDHTFGNSDFEKLGAAIISHAACKNILKSYGEGALQNAQNYGLTEEDLAGTEIAYPVLTFQDRMEVDMGDQKIELIYNSSSHTDGSILVYMSDRKVLFAGDILFTNYHPFMADGDIGKWVKVLDYIMTLDVDTIIPGHGPISGKKDVRDMKDYIIAFDKKAKELAAKSEDVEYMTSEIIKSLPSRDEGGGLIPANIQMKYLKK